MNDLLYLHVYLTSAGPFLPVLCNSGCSKTKLNEAFKNELLFLHFWCWENYISRLLQFDSQVKAGEDNEGGWRLSRQWQGNDVM